MLDILGGGLLGSIFGGLFRLAPVDKAAWAAYRQELRDITAQAGFPWNVQWPAKVL